VPEDAISGTIPRCILYSLLTFSKDYVNLYKKVTLPYNKIRETIVEGLSGQNCIFGRFSLCEKQAILSSQKASALLVAVSLESDG